MGDLQVCESTGIDALERLQIHIHIQSQTVESTTMSHAYAERANLGAVNIDPGRSIAALGSYTGPGQRIDHALLDQVYVAANAQTQTPQIQQRVGHDLTRAMVGDLAPTIASHNRNTTRCQQMLAPPSLTQGEYRVVLKQPQLIDGMGVTL